MWDKEFSSDIDLFTFLKKQKKLLVFLRNMNDVNVCGLDGKFRLSTYLELLPPRWFSCLAGNKFVCLSVAFTMFFLNPSVSEHDST